VTVKWCLPLSAPTSPSLTSDPLSTAGDPIRSGRPMPAAEEPPIRGAPGGDARPRLAGVEARAVLMRLAQRLAGPLGAARPVETVPVLPALHALFLHAIR
jgi:hypothetical protein